MVVVVLRSDFPFVDDPAAPGGFHPVFGCEVFGDKLVLQRSPTVKRQIAFIPDRHRQSVEAFLMKIYCGEWGLKRVYSMKNYLNYENVIEIKMILRSILSLFFE